jgi:hypothetical protein
MIRTIITPQNTDLHIAIPQKYVGKRVEITFHDLDETEKKASNSNETENYWVKKYKGAMSKESKNVVDTQLNELRNTWE